MNKEQLSQAIGFYFIYPFLWVAGFMPLVVLYRLSDFFFVIVALVGYRRKVINDNLRRAFPQKSNAEIRNIRIKFYRHFCDIFVETMVLLHVPVKKIHKRVKLVNPELLQELAEQERDVVAVLGHYCNWEWIPATNGYGLKAQGVSIYRPLKNPYFDKYMLKLRARFGASNVAMKQTAREIVNLKRQNRRFILGLICDQSPSLFELNYWTTFLNQNTPVILGPEKMAKLANAKVVYWKMEKLKRGYYQITFIPYPKDEKESEEFEITEWQVRMLEKQIMEKPQYWLWSHKRWKYQHHFKPIS